MNSTLILFGASKRWVPPPWTTTDDRVRGGASQSYLTALPNNCARFHGHLDTSTLGGAGFASQFSPLDAAGAGDGERRDGWNLSAYDGIEVAVGKGDGKVYTLILKDDVPVEKRQDGREKAGVNWEVEFDVAVKGGEEKSAEESEDTRVWVPWGDFMATYRGKAKEDAGDIKTGQIRRVGLMMRSYFGKQDGDFSQELQSISARKYVAGDKQPNASHNPTAARQKLFEPSSLTIRIIAKKYNQLPAPVVRRWSTVKLPNITTTQVVVPALKYTTHAFTQLYTKAEQVTAQTVYSKGSPSRTVEAGIHVFPAPRKEQSSPKRWAFKLAFPGNKIYLAIDASDSHPLTKGNEVTQAFHEELEYANDAILQT